MLRISKLTDYAIIILTDIARQSNCGSNAKAIADRTDLGLATVKKILRQLKQHDILNSEQGVSGGYSLTIPAANLSIARIIQAMEGDIAITQCSSKTHDCKKVSNCHVSNNWQHINSIIFRALDNISINEMQCPHTEWQTIRFDAFDNKALTP